MSDTHTAIITRVIVSRHDQGEPSPREAYEIRRRRLVEAGTEHHADPTTLTLRYREPHSTDDLGWSEHVTITYAAPGQEQGALDLEEAS